MLRNRRPSPETRAAPLISPHSAARASAYHSAQEGWTSLMAASENGHDKAVALLLDRGAKINATDEVRGARHGCVGGQQACRAACAAG